MTDTTPKIITPDKTDEPIQETDNGVSEVHRQYGLPKNKHYHPGLPDKVAIRFGRLKLVTIGTNGSARKRLPHVEGFIVNLSKNQAIKHKRRLIPINMLNKSFHIGSAQELGIKLK